MRPNLDYKRRKYGSPGAIATISGLMTAIRFFTPERTTITNREEKPGGCFHHTEISIFLFTWHIFMRKILQTKIFYIRSKRDKTD